MYRCTGRVFIWQKKGTEQKRTPGMKRIVGPVLFAKVHPGTKNNMNSMVSK